MRHLDEQLSMWSEKLQSEVKISAEDSSRLATAIANDVRWLDPESKEAIKRASPVPISARYDELIAFQSWMDIVHSSSPPPPVVRAQVITQNYICFVYLNESCFNILRKHLPDGSASKKCCKFLVSNPVRAFRNAVAHSNWCYKEDFSGLRYWSRKRAEADEPMSEFEVSSDDMAFWQTLARGVAYAAYEQLK
jgi:hypothetical protein